MLVANNEEINLGNLPFGRGFNFKYVITNSGDKVINLKTITVGCGSCTKAYANKNVLAAGESGEIFVTFTPGSTGIQTKQITVTYTFGDIKPTNLVLKFKAMVDK